MKIAILGAGAMGSVFGALLAKGNEVWLIDVWQEHVDRINADGLKLIRHDGSEEVVQVRATTDPADVGAAELVIVFVKSTDTTTAVEGALSLVGDDTVFLTVQNGLGNWEAIASVIGAEQTLFGVTFDSAVLIGPGCVRHANAAKTTIGEVSDAFPAGRVERVATALTTSGIETSVTDSPLREAWLKLWVNAVFNAACAITGCRSGDIARFKDAQEFAALVATETAAVARAQGVEIPFPDPLERILEISRGAGDAKPSMLQDIERERWTEVDAINGAVVRAGAAAGIDTPFNRALTLLVRMLEARQHDGEREGREPLP